MTVTLYSNKSPSNFFTKDITSVWSGTGTLRESCDILNPAILIDADLSAYLKTVNYMNIDSFGRYYFISAPIVSTHGLYAISGQVDPFMSWRNEILENYAIISRQEKSYNLFLDDGTFKAYSNPIIQRINFPTGFNSTEFILAVAGGLAT